MKGFMRIYKWIVLAIMFQIIVFSYLEFVYLPNRGTVRATSFEFSDDEAEDKSIKIPDDADGITVSYDGSYAVYMQKGKLTVIDVKKKGKVLKALEASGGEFTFFRWLPDRDMLIYSIKEPEGKTGQVMISTFDLGPDLERSYPKITGLPDGSVVTDIELSPLTNIVYTMVKTGKTRIKVYKYNIMDDLSSVINTGVNAVFKETVYSDNLIYQDEEGKITVRSGKSGKKTYLPVKGSLKLLAVDAEDNIYAGQLDDTGKITAVHYGKADAASKEWKKTELGASFELSKVVITPNGNIYTVSDMEKSVSNVTNGNKFTYGGELLEVVDDYIVSKDDRKLKLTAITKKDE